MASQGLSKHEVLESAGAIIEGKASKVGTTDDDIKLWECAHRWKVSPGIFKLCSEPRSEAVNWFQTKRTTCRTMDYFELLLSRALFSGVRAV